MPRATANIASFAGGEMSPYLWGRTDHSRYFISLRKALNAICLPTGAVTRRGGTRHVGHVKHAANAVRLIPFEFSDVQTYVIEAGPNYFRIYKDRGRIEAGGVPVEIATPYSAADLPRLRWCQSADVMYLVHPRHRPQKLSRTSHTTWTLQEVALQDGPYEPENITPTTLQPASTEGLQVVTASGTGGINGGAGFLPTDVARRISLKSGTVRGWGIITQVLSPTQVVVAIQKQFGSLDATSAWRLGRWCDTTGIWPSCVTFHEERLVFASGQRIDGSKTGDFETFSPGIEDGDAFSFSIGSNQVQEIRWLSSQRVLLAGAMGAVFIVSADSASAPLTPTNAQAKPHGVVGAADIAAVQADVATLFVERSGAKVRELKYSFQDDGYLATDLTLFAGHVGEAGFRDMAWQQAPHGILWGVLADGTLAACTYMPDQEIIAWHRHQLAGDAVVESVAVIAGRNAADEVWFAVRRGDQRTLEVLEEPLALTAQQADAVYVDAALSYRGAPATVLSGLEHLEGRTVAILADGAVHPPQVVQGGSVTLQWAASTVHVGLPYRTDIEPMPLEAGQGEGTAQGKVKRISEVTVRLLRSLGGYVGRDAANLEEITYRDPSVPMDQAPPLYTGDKRVLMGGEYQREATVLITSEAPLPLTVTAIIPKVVTSDG